MVLSLAVMKVRARREGPWRLASLARAGVLALPLIYAVAAGNNVLDSHAFAQRWIAPELEAGNSGPSAVSLAEDEEDDTELVEVYKSTGPRKIPEALRRMLGLPPEDRQEEEPRNEAGKGVLPASLYDLAEYADRYRERRIVTDGMVAWDEKNKNRFYLFRFVVVCCIADAQPAAVLVECPATERPAPNSWMRVEGIADIVKVDKRAGVIIRKASLAPIRTPKDPYLY
jgi:uncharacterized repeat protein (TIGR03943 family)